MLSKTTEGAIYSRKVALMNKLGSSLLKKTVIAGCAKRSQRPRRALLVIVSVKRGPESTRARSRTTSTNEGEAILTATKHMSLFQQPAKLLRRPAFLL